MKYRRNKVKREHGIIQNALPWLENLSRLLEVTDIIPGVIDVNHSSERGIVYKYETQTGCKLLLKSNGSIQEAFVVTRNPALVQAWVEKEFPQDQKTIPVIVVKQNKLPEKSEKKLPRILSTRKMESKRKAATPVSQPSKKRSERLGKKAISAKSKPLNVADQLDLTTLEALNILKQTLEKTKAPAPKTKPCKQLRKKTAKNK